MAAEIECTVDLDRGQKGVHMSRFAELFDEAIEEVVLGDALLVEVLAERIARHIVERQRALRAEARITARWPIRRTTPVTGLPTQEMVSLIGIAAATGAGARRVVGVEATGINACPCAQGMIRGHASERLLEAGFEDGDVERILELVPLATHNQRGRGTILVGTEPGARRRGSRRDRRALDVRPGARTAQAAGRAVRRRARASAATLRGGLGAPLAQGPARGQAGSRGRRLRACAPAQPRDDPRPRRAGRALAARSESSAARSSRALPAQHQTALAEWLGSGG